MNVITRLFDRFYDDVILEFRDQMSMQQLAPLYNGFFPWSGASLRPTTIAYLLNDIFVHDRQMIVELGSGLSTIFIASLLEKLDRKVVFHSVDHDEYWQNLTRDELVRRNVASRVELIHAPLSASDWSYVDSCHWYDAAILDVALPLSGIDLLFVDGPPANTKGNEFARYPALPYLKPRLDNNCKVILDDGSRRGEADIARQWGELLGRPFRKDRLNGNIFVSNPEKGEYNV